MKQIDWNKLKSYSGDNKKSFEELCYQIVSEKFKNEIANDAILTSIDDSGGGDGVEFYLTLSNGDVYGWQAKFFCRLSKGGRKEQIKQSLQTAYKKHPNLKKWFLCSRCNFTSGEITWFDTSLAISQKNGEIVLPKSTNIKLIHWGEDEFLNFIRQYPDIKNFFFSEKVLTQKWFEDRYKIDVETSQIKARYESRIHIPTDIDDTVNKLLGGEKLAEILEREMENQQVVMCAEEYENALSNFFSEDVEDEYKNIQLEFKKLLQDKSNLIKNGVQKLEELKKLVLDRDEINLKIKVKEFEVYIKTLLDFYNEYDKLTDSELCKSIKYLREGHEEEPLAIPGKGRKKFANRIFSFFKKFLIKKEPEKEYSIPTQEKESEEIKTENRRRSKARDILFGPLYSLKEYAIPSLELSYRVFELIDQNELHISGEAGMGKTHVSFNIYEDQIVNKKQPAIFIFAKDIATNRSLEEQLKDELSIPTDWSFDDFLGALEIAARINKIKIPIIIDGLNESTFWDSVWKTGLERLILKIKEKYQHLVVIATYRTSYEDQLFHKNYFDYKTNKDRWKIRQVVRGFEGLTWEAIQIYFDFYKIKLGSHSNAIGYFEHPLYLKLFCKTKNPDRKKEVNVSFQNEDLFEVFDEYINNSNKNITNALQELDAKYDSDFTKNKLLKLSEYIWVNNSRGIPRSENLFLNDELRIFEGENLLIFRDWNKDKNKEEVQFTYDLLGGYFISKYLIQAYENSYPLVKINSDNFLLSLIKTGLEFKIPESGTNLLGKLFLKINKKLGGNKPLLRFAKSKEFRNKLLNKKTEHPLFDDILKTISILLIKKSKIFLFNVLKDEKAKKYSTESLFEINKKYIKENEQLIKDFLKEEFLNQSNKNFLFDLAENIELDIDHPLNFNFWSDLLKELSITERDLSWSEYIRKNHSWYGNSHFANFIRNFEGACKNKEKLSGRVHIAAKKVMWILTTNIRKLRDEATRALYYYARRYPKEFLELLKYSLRVNDPYVPERILAVSYGLAMARQNDFKDNSYQKKWLPKCGRFLFDSIFSKNAKYTNTHFLARDYAKRTIDMALLHHPDLLKDTEKQQIIYPLKNYPHRAWGESEDRDRGVYRDGNAPIQMDFENYTIGRLIKNRRNYDSEHNEYKKVLSGIYWRIYDLGYSLAKFGEIDKQIARKKWNYSRHDNTGKTDRYGKKYSWIAFYEMAGYRSDLGLLKGWDDEYKFRISDVDIDPSFPLELKQYNLFDDLGNDNFLGDESKPPNTWYEVKDDLNTDKYIRVKNAFDEKEEHEWVLLKGVISQKDKDDQTKDVHIALNAVFVGDEDYEKIIDITKKHYDYTFEYIRNIEDHYLFEGEIPWCDLMPKYYSEDFKVLYNYRDVKKIKKELKILNYGKELTQEELSNLKEKEEEYLQESLKETSDGKIEISLPFLVGNHDDEITKKVAKKMEYTTKYIDVTYSEKQSNTLEIDIETTIFENSWESYHSDIIPSSETVTPSKIICENLELFLKPQSSDMYNKDGEIVSTSFKYGKGYDSTSTFTYIRKDYLEKYLQSRNKKIIWFQWAEKRYFPNGIKKLDFDNERSKTEYRTYYRIIL